MLKIFWIFLFHYATAEVEVFTYRFAAGGMVDIILTFTLPGSTETLIYVIDEDEDFYDFRIVFYDTFKVNFKRDDISVWLQAKVLNDKPIGFKFKFDFIQIKYKSIEIGEINDNQGVEANISDFDERKVLSLHKKPLAKAYNNIDIDVTSLCVNWATAPLNPIGYTDPCYGTQYFLTKVHKKPKSTTSTSQIKITTYLNSTYRRITTLHKKETDLSQTIPKITSTQMIYYFALIGWFSGAVITITNIFLCACIVRRRKYLRRRNTNIKISK